MPDFISSFIERRDDLDFMSHQQLGDSVVRSAPDGKAPPGCSWFSRVQGAIHWIDAFLRGHEGSLSRTFTLDAYENVGTDVDITGDACPWGLGAELRIAGITNSWFADKLTEHDVMILGHPIGSADGQQVWEMLAMLSPCGS